MTTLADAGDKGAKGGRKPARKATAADVEVLNPDEWGEGLRFALKALNIKTVKLAKVANAVLLVCLQHNLRKDNGRHRHRYPIDRARTPQNTVLLGAAEPSICAEVAVSILDELGIEPARCDTIMGVELVFQPPRGWDVARFYDECLTWLARRYTYVISAVVHRDQKRPHLHVLALAVTGEQLAGAAMTSKQNRLEAQRSDFMRHMRATLGLRPDREAKSLARPSALTKLATSAGKGPKTHAAADKSDAELERRASARTTDLIAHQPHSPAEIQTNLIAPTSYCASLSDVLRLFAEGVSAGLFPSTPLRPVTPAPRPLTPPQPAPSRNRSRGWILPPSMLTPPVAASPQAAPADAPGRATRCRPFVIPPDLLAELQRRSTP